MPPKVKSVTRDRAVTPLFRRDQIRHLIANMRGPGGRKPTEAELAAYGVACPVCPAREHWRCREEGGPLLAPHAERMTAAAKPAARAG
jgi:hypothetical protein